MNDNVELRKSNGASEANLKAIVRGTKIHLDAGKLPIEPGDVIVRKLSTGVVETYRVVDPGFHEPFLDFPARYQLKVLKVEEPPVDDDEMSEERKQSLFRRWEEIGLDIIKQDLGNGGHTYIGGPPATRKLAMQWARMKDAEREQERTNIHVSGPNARVNLHSADHSINIAVAGDLFASIREAIAKEIAEVSERSRLVGLLDKVESSKDKSGFISAYQKLIADAANHITILAPFLPALTQLLQSYPN